VPIVARLRQAKSAKKIVQKAATLRDSLSLESETS
jgi:hypothetical protein